MKEENNKIPRRGGGILIKPGQWGEAYYINMLADKWLLLKSIRNLFHYKIELDNWYWNAVWKIMTLSFVDVVKVKLSRQYYILDYDKITP